MITHILQYEINTDYLKTVYHCKQAIGCKLKFLETQRSEWIKEDLIWWNIYDYTRLKIRKKSGQ